MFSYSLDDPETKRIKVQPHSKKKLTVSFLIVSSTCRWPRNQSTVSSSFFLAGSRHLMIKLHVYHLVYVGYVVISFFWQQLRKLLLEILHRIPTNEHLRPHFQVHFTTEMLKNRIHVHVLLQSWKSLQTDPIHGIVWDTSTSLDNMHADFV